jgi:hypothetical protein
MRGIVRDLMIYSLVLLIFTSALVLLGEYRIDAYLAISILIYFVLTTILPNIRRQADLRITDILFIIVFIVIVALRVLEVLGYKFLVIP